MSVQTRLFDRDPELGITRLFHWDDSTEDFHIETVSDVTDIIEANKARYNGTDERAGWRGDLHCVGSIPMDLYFKLRAAGIIGNPERMKKWVNDPDNRLFRTRPGRI